MSVPVLHVNVRPSFKDVTSTSHIVLMLSVFSLESHLCKNDKHKFIQPCEDLVSGAQS